MRCAPRWGLLGWMAVLIGVCSTSHTSEDEFSRVESEVLVRLEALLEALNGGHCVSFNSRGWWNYRWCHKRQVVQFHQQKEKNERSVEVSAGVLNPNEEGGRLGWASGSRKSHRKRGPPQYLSYSFIGGERCAKVGRTRRSEVRIKCCKSAMDHQVDLIGGETPLSIEKLAWIHSVVEVNTCSYLMTVCSPVGCLMGSIWEEVRHAVSSGRIGAETNECSNSSVLQLEENGKGSSMMSADNEDEKWTIHHDSNSPSSPESHPDEAKVTPVAGHEFLSPEEKLEMREHIRSAFYHGFDSYMMLAFPFDELKPLTCRGEDLELTAGDMLTLIDSLDMLAILGNSSEFSRGVDLVANKANFDLDETVSVFETTIRILGGLLSAHLLASDDKLQLYPAYDGSLLPIAQDLGERLLPAFNTTTSIPYGTVNLRRGVPSGETTEACTAAAGSLSIEFGVLSVLTGDRRYGVAARDALKALFDHRSKLGLVGRHIDVMSGKWTEPLAGIGSNIDSMYEYYLKHYVAFGDDEAFVMFETLYEAAVRHLRMEDTWYIDANMHHGNVQRKQFNNLQAFWPGMQTLVGDLQSASQTINAFLQVWNDFGFTPEDFSIEKWMPLSGGSRRGYPLRPELAESVFYMSTTTQDESWLVAGRDMMKSLDLTCRVDCGFASVKDIKSERLYDAMPSFFLSELLKYLYLLYDEENFLRDDRGGNYVFTTEAHPVPVTSEFQRLAREMGFAFPERRRKRRIVDEPKLWGVHSITDRGLRNERMCPAFELDVWKDSIVFPPYYGADPELRKPRRFGYFKKSASEGNVHRRDAAHDDHQLDLETNIQVLQVAPGDVGRFEVEALPNGFYVHHEFSNSALTIGNLGAEIVSIELTNGDSSESTYLFIDAKHTSYALQCSVHFHHATENPSLDDVCEAPPLFVSDSLCLPSETDIFQKPVACSFSEFGPGPVEQFLDGELVSAKEMNGCTAKAFPEREVKNKVVLVRRGGCMFEQKAKLAEAAGAKAIVVVQNHADEEEGLFYMVRMASGNLIGQALSALFSASGTRIPAFMISKAHGDVLFQRLHNHKVLLDLKVEHTKGVFGEGTSQFPWAGVFNSKIGGMVSHLWGFKIERAKTQWRFSVIIDDSEK